MIRTAILAAMLLVMLSMAYSRTGQLPDLRTASEPTKVEPKPEPQVAAVSEPVAPPSPRTNITVRPGVDPDAPMTPVRPTIAKTRSVTPPPAQLQPIAAPSPEASLVPTAAPQAEPVLAAQPAPAAQPLPAPVVAKAAPIAPEPVLPKIAEVPPEPAVATNVTPVDEMPVKQVATPRVMMPRDLPLPSEPPVAKMAPRTVAAGEMMDDGFPAPPTGANVTGANVTPPQPKESAAPKPADAPRFMSREERTRELYRLAREMEDTFISKLAR